MTEPISFVAENFSLTGGGPFHRIISLIGPARSERQRVINRALFAVLICWAPLLALAFLQGLAISGKVTVPFLKDYAVQLRFLVALPILILAETPIDRRWRSLAHEFVKSGLIRREEAGNYDAVIERLSRLRDRILPEIAMLFVAYAAPIFLGKTELLMSKISNWHMLDAGATEASLAGWWFWLVSAPFFRFLLLRWIWRMFLWTLFLWSTSHLKLYLVATHADLAAGMGFISKGQRAYTPVVFAGGTVIAGSVLNAIRYEGATLSSSKVPMIAYGVMALLVLVAPLLVVAPVLLKVKRKALVEYGALVTSHNQQFDTKWLRSEHGPGESILGNPDASSLIDLGSSFAVIRQMSIVPVEKSTLISLALAAALPMVPVILLTTPADEIIHAVLKMLG